MKLRVHYVMHASFETPGSIEHWAKQRGHVFSGTQAYEDQLLPDSRDIDFLIVMGGPQSALRIGDFPYLRDEINLIVKLIEQKKPIVGICLGSQLIAEALGARTRGSPEKEVGTFPVQLTHGGTQDPILRKFPAEFEVLHWHYDMPGIPDGAVLLARSAGCPHQAFRYGDRVYGFQFHMESTADSIKLLLQNGANDLAPSKYTQTAKDISSSDFATMNERLAHALDSLVAIAHSSWQVSCHAHDIGQPADHRLEQSGKRLVWLRAPDNLRCNREENLHWLTVLRLVSFGTYYKDFERARNRHGILAFFCRRS